jgi:hypothetical protein
VACGSQALEAISWRAATVTGNTFVATDTDVPNSGSFLNLVITASGAPSSAFTWNNNAYYDGAPPSSDNGYHSYYYNGIGGWLTFDQWRSNTGWDAASQNTVGLPTGQQVFVRPNEYEPGRANITVFNWSHASTVSVDVSSVLPVGSLYEVRNTQNWNAGPILQGTYNGGSLVLPMTGLTVARPVGYTWTPQSTAPAYNTFVLIKR